MKMKRRTFIKSSALAGLTFAMDDWWDPKKTHILTLSFDDGFKKSFYRLAEIHEEYGLKACLNIIASGHLPGFKGVDQWILPELMGDFNDWNKLKSRGHEIMPHTWEHLNLTKVPLNQAKENMDKCLDYFKENLDGYADADAVYNFAFNASTPELEDHILKRVRAVRTGGWLVLKDTVVNFAQPGKNRLGCWSKGPEYCDDYVEEEINHFLKSPGGWLILNLHGLDGEGWGPVHTAYLDGLLKKSVRLENLAIKPSGEVLKALSL
jgi:peptidoglycan/xylan/chitin deacetylase (PgdA/CDA1 family)